MNRSLAWACSPAQAQEQARLSNRLLAAPSSRIDSVCTNASVLADAMGSIDHRRSARGLHIGDKLGNALTCRGQVECRRHGEAGQSALAEPVRSLIRPLSIGRAVASGGTALTLGFGVASAVAGVATAADGMRLPQGADSRSPTRRWPVGCVLHRVPAPICSW